ncbi:MAG TPA: restriction endonuclease [Longimicrobium sp.]|jgi:restriction system protein
MNPLLQALRDLGGSGSIDEIYEKVAETLKLPEEVLSVPHDPEKSNQSEVQYQLAWARTYLKKYGILENSSRGVWVITTEKRHVQKVDTREVLRTVREMGRRERALREAEEPNGETVGEDAPEEVHSWRARLHHVLTQRVDPAGFERLVKRLLRESGFVHVEVTGRSGDGGIDGKGIARLSGLLSFHVIFQCKRYQGAVSAGHIRDFRGAMVGRADKGLFITTGTFTRDALREATRDGAPPIDLIDGDQLAEKLKELNLGINTEVVEKVAIDENWFLTL